jgi:hypothetical protein
MNLIRIPNTLHFKIVQFVSGILLFSMAIIGYSADMQTDLTLPVNSSYTQEHKSFILAANNTDTLKANITAKPTTPESEFQAPLLSKRKIHQYFGLSTIALAGLTALAAPDECRDANCPPRDVNGTHATLAKATIAMAAATIATGLYAHWDDFHVSDGWADPDNLHILLGVTGAALMAYAVNKSANSSVPVNHAGIAEAGAVLMVVAIKLTW